MKAYSFDNYGVFLGMVAMQKDPLESRIQKKDVWLLPSRATLTAPPPNELPEGSFHVWNGSRWTVRSVPTDEIAKGFRWVWVGDGWVVQKDQTYEAPPEDSLPHLNPPDEPHESDDPAPAE